MFRRKPTCSTIHRDVCLRVGQNGIFTNKQKRNYSISSNDEFRTIFEQYAKKNNITPADWYQLSSTSLDEKLRQLVSTNFGGSLYRALSSVFPEIEWKAWKFQQRVPQNFWKEQSNQRKFFDDLGHTLGVKSLDDWYEKLSQKEVLKHPGGATILSYNDSPAAALMAAYPEHNWVPWKFASSAGFWNDVSNQRKFFDEIGKQLGIEKMDDWYSKLSVDIVKKHGGAGLLKQYDESPIAALMAAYSEYNWEPRKFFISVGYWNKSNQKQFFDDLGKQLGIQTLDDWYEKLAWDVIVKNGGSTLLKQYNDSPTYTLMSAYPDHNWIPWKFSAAPKGIWDSKDTVKKFLNELSEKLSIQTLDDWYRVDRGLLHQLGAAGLLAKYKGLYNILKEQYPHHPWDPNRFKKVGKKAQRWLAVTLKKIFPNEEILEDYMHPKAVFPSSQRPIQLDIYIPSKSLAFEYQGEQHYQDIGVFSLSRSYQQRDEEKRTVCAANNIKLIEVPYWWNKTQEELLEIIHKSGFVSPRKT